MAPAGRSSGDRKYTGSSGCECGAAAPACPWRGAVVTGGGHRPAVRAQPVQPAPRVTDVVGVAGARGSGGRCVGHAAIGPPGAVRRPGRPSPRLTARRAPPGPS
ncbi:hypothetical protein Ae168Ps1_3778 [Pseudonocardia sp. Ae168_Ps1]|nr:hypothetical protein Ae168Ps1_3778 [Pseudonocardia sp. Ae168_Ps1]OLL84514.1 hypothetical protein Ae263Ps1_1569c [Pseudonocardia sp. Ae263_Ps1]